MSRLLTIAAAQMGPVQLADSRDDVVDRLVGQRGVIPPPEESR